jgi:hypothetical protein
MKLYTEIYMRFLAEYLPEGNMLPTKVVGKNETHFMVYNRLVRNPYTFPND